MKALVIKVGGAFIGDKQAAANLLGVIKELQAARPVVLVHGGGPIVEEWMTALNLKTVKIDGLRVSTDEQMPYVVGALAGTANKDLVAQAIAANLVPVGLALTDGAMVKCTPMDKKYGAVGSAKAGDAKLLNLLLSQQFLPIVSSIGASSSGQLLNINADQAATAIAQLLHAELVLLSDVPGVLDADKQLIPELRPADINRLVEQNVIRDGMTVKVNAALEAAGDIGLPVIIASWKQPQALLGLAHEGSAGTRIYPS
ncbi:acetylglutamate kinase [Aliiglaciecola sp. CAU 1673]|uniref:acetylglutamate kinase n=1 Tax=Aliiglaciecola sp. CAU 1673 TaxID=3032595 RepID=UPI0023DB112C|nr:acetylglutamate kinase [Aliiglaciecola sp. CAU 1673]MDF2178688.1 acetylglutamate kinase [Aliiglaciecola sp. CAU 1673]